MKTLCFFAGLVSFQILLFSRPALGCPLIDGMVDYNCDQKHRVVIAGDSVVQGIGDQVNNNNGGYPKRLGNSLAETKVINNGISGFTTRNLLSRYRSGDFLQRTRNADVVIIDVGRNDCRDGASGASAVSNVKRLVSFIRKRIKRLSGVAPYVIVSTQIPNRDDRRSCIQRLNQNYLRNRSNKLPVRLRFDKLPASVLSGDGLHPDAKGYARIADRTESFLRTKGNSLLLKRRKDTDQDNIYDLFEKDYGTDPSNPDTDGDGKLDGDEIFVLGSDPTVAD